MDAKKKIFPYPAVEYIPLPFTVLQEGRNEKRQGVQLFTVKNPEELVESFGEMEIPPQKQHIYLLLVNVGVLAVKYRGYTVTILGEEKEKFYQLGALPTKYFYKDQLSLALFTAEGENLARDSLTLKL